MVTGVQACALPIFSPGRATVPGELDPVRDTVYIATADGIKLSWDRGTTWAEITDSLGAVTAPHLWGRLRSQYILALAAGPDGSLWAGHLRGLARSLDGARSWPEFPTPLRSAAPAD